MSSIIFFLFQVIGDKKGGKTSKFLSKKKWGKLREEVLDEINLPLRLIHMVRNPFDNIATMTFRSLEISTDKAKATEKKVYDLALLDLQEEVLDPAKLFGI